MAWGVRIGEIGFDERHTELSSYRPGASRLGAPPLPRIVGRPTVDEHGCAGTEQPSRDRVADPGAATHTGDERIAARQVHAREPTSLVLSPNRLGELRVDDVGVPVVDVRLGPPLGDLDHAPDVGAVRQLDAHLVERRLGAVV